MCDIQTIQSKLGPLIQKLKKLTADSEAKIARLPKCEDVMTNSRVPEDMIDKLEELSRFQVVCMESICTGLQRYIDYPFIDEFLSWYPCMEEEEEECYR